MYNIHIYNIHKQYMILLQVANAWPAYPRIFRTDYGQVTRRLNEV